MVCVGVNVTHDELCKWLMRSFVDYNAVPPKDRKVAKPVYTGGDARMEAVAPHAHIAIAFETVSPQSYPGVFIALFLPLLRPEGAAACLPCFFVACWPAAWGMEQREPRGLQPPADHCGWGRRVQHRRTWQRHVH